MIARLWCGRPRRSAGSCWIFTNAGLSAAPATSSAVRRADARAAGRPAARRRASPGTASAAGNRARGAARAPRRGRDPVRREHHRRAGQLRELTPASCGAAGSGGRSWLSIRRADRYDDFPGRRPLVRPRAVGCGHRALGCRSGGAGTTLGRRHGRARTVADVPKLGPDLRLGHARSRAIGGAEAVAGAVEAGEPRCRRDREALPRSRRRIGEHRQRARHDPPLASGARCRRPYAVCRRDRRRCAARDGRTCPLSGARPLAHRVAVAADHRGRAARRALASAESS